MDAITQRKPQLSTAENGEDSPSLIQDSPPTSGEKPPIPPPPNQKHPPAREKPLPKEIILTITEPVTQPALKPAGEPAPPKSTTHPSPSPDAPDPIGASPDAPMGGLATWWPRTRGEQGSLALSAVVGMAILSRLVQWLLPTHTGVAVLLGLLLGAGVGWVVGRFQRTRPGGDQ